MITRRLANKSIIGAATAFAFLLATLLAATTATATQAPRKQVQSCMQANHWHLPPSLTELSNARFTSTLQRCLTKAHIATYTAKQLDAYDSCLIKHHVTLGKTPHTSSAYKKAKTVCRATLLLSR